MTDQPKKKTTQKPKRQHAQTEPEPEPAITAQPTIRVPGRLTPGRRYERDLTLEPEELGRHFLSEAVEQGDEPSLIGADVELDPNEPAPSDDVTVGVNENAEGQ